MTGDVDGVDGRDAGDGHDRVAGNPADTGRPADAHEVTAPDGRAITRRQLLIGASVAGLSAVGRRRPAGTLRWGRLRSADDKGAGPVFRGAEREHLSAARCRHAG